LTKKYEVAGRCELLGIDPRYEASEGKMPAFVAKPVAAAALAAMHSDPLD